jgi:hypothetical protein
MGDRRGVCTQDVKWRDLGERGHLETLGVDWTTILKRIITLQNGNTDWTDLAQVTDK